MAGRPGAQPVAAETEDSRRRLVGAAADSPSADQLGGAAKPASPDTAAAGRVSQMPTPFRRLHSRLAFGPLQGEEQGETEERHEAADDVYFSPLDSFDRNPVALRLLRSEPSTPASRQLLNPEDYDDDDDEPDTPPNGSAAYAFGEVPWAKSSSFASVGLSASITTADGRAAGVALLPNSPPTTPSMNRFPGPILASTASCPELLSLFDNQASSTRFSSPLRELTSMSDSPLPPPAEQATKQRSAAQVYNGAPLKPAPRVVHSLWDYLKEEITTSDVDDISDVKGERVKNFLNVPRDFEKVRTVAALCAVDERRL
ncbi:MAG: hypothetical protein BJ554DRAFT_1430 [Olpidium bornovanus]|uniref:Uncharacterized protein n=1 Tax=Olpidium bornovanus TaxID=278681 RepID=A0A8H7ZRL6_9FUNG|nr:MAG: hypothetical protein BJ554DRAFT_1430 [Olpidium bornovanus]